MEFSPTIMQQVSGARVQSPYRGRQSESSPARSSASYESFLSSPVSGMCRVGQQQHDTYLNSVEDDHLRLSDRQVEHIMASPHSQMSPKRQYPPFVSCMFAAAAAASSPSASSPLSSPSSVPTPAPSSPLLSSPASASSSPYYHHHHQRHHNHHRKHNNNNNHHHFHTSAAATKRQMMWKENNPSPHHHHHNHSLYPHPHSPANSGVPHPPAVSPNKTSLSHCKRRLDFNHNPVTENDLDLNINVNFATSAAATSATHSHNIDDLALTFSHDLSPRLTHTPGADAMALGRVPAVAVARRNERERNRVKLINMTFATLREHLPHAGGNKGGKSRKMSKVETLRAAIEYIRQLHTLIKEKQQQQHSSNPKSTKDSHNDIHRQTIKQEVEYDHEDNSTPTLKVKALKMEVDDGGGGAVVGGGAGSSFPLELASPSSQSRSPGGAGSPVSDDGCCFTYDLLGTEDEDLLEFASNWF